MKKRGTIYKIENKENGKVYVGQTIQNFRDRVYAHKNKLKHNKHYNNYLQNAWNKYGSNNFRFKVIKKVSINKLDKIEKKYIKKYKNINKSYNIELGGNNKKVMAKETIKKIADSQKKKVILLNTMEIFESIKKASKKYNVKHNGISSCCNKKRDHAGQMNKNEWMVWRFLEDYDPEEKINFKRTSANNKKPVICINTGETFETMKEAGKRYGINPTNISAVCRGSRKSTYSENKKRLQFDYYEEGKEYEEKNLKGNFYPKPIICKTTGEKFNSIYKGAKKYKADIRSVSNNCKGKCNYAGKLEDGTKLKWEFLN